MSRSSISLTDPNEKWIASMIARKEYATKTDAVNDAIRRARRDHEYREFINAKLEASEQSGLTGLSKDEILQEIKEELRQDEKL